MSGSMTVIGADKVEKLLLKMERKAAIKEMKKAQRPAAKIIEAEVKARAPVNTGALKKSIKTRAGRTRKGSVSTITGAGKKWFTGKTFYAAFQEWGWKAGKRNRRKGAGPDTRRAIPGKEFTRKGSEAKRIQAVHMVVDNLRRQLFGSGK